MQTNQDVTIDFMHYGEITIPKGTRLTHMTAMGIDHKYHFVNDFGWIAEKYPAIANILTMDAKSRGINIPKEFVEGGRFQDDKSFYDWTEPQNKERTRKRLAEMEDLGMEEVGIAQFGLPGKTSGLYIERVWSYNDEDWTGYMDWIRAFKKED